MERCFHKVFFFLTLLFTTGQSYAGAGAAPLIQAPGFQDALSKTSGLVKIGYGCGWDYPCPPRPDFGRAVNSQVNIDRVYGDVNVYSDGYRDVYRPYYPAPCTSYRCREPVEIDVVPYEPPPYYPPAYRVEEIEPPYPSCSGYPCSEKCGPHCWFRRFKNGYCGHGCEYYREKVRFKPVLKTIVVPKPVYYKEIPVPRAYYPPTHYKAPPPPLAAKHGHPTYDDSGPLRRYEGPPYPPQ